MHSPIDPLDSLLTRWQNEQPPPHSPLTKEVWRRIADAETPPITAGFWERLDMVFSRPSFAVAFVGVCVLTGLFLAEARLSRLHADRNAKLERSYVELVDPLLKYPAPAQPTATSTTNPR